MVQQMIDAKVNEYGLSNSGSGIPTRDKPPPVSIKKTPLRDLQNETRNIISKPQNNSPLLKDNGLPVDAVKVCGIKRPIPDCPPSPTCNPSPCNNGSNSHLVYARRKAESEHGKTNACNVENENHPQSIKSNNSNKHESTEQENKMRDPKIPCFPAFTTIPVAPLSPFSSGEPSIPHSLGKPADALTATEQNYPMATSGIPFLVSPQSQKTYSQQRQESFDRLQAFLKSCDDSNQDEYIRMLWSLSAVGRSRQAIELEKRAIHLSLEEGKEFQRVMYLNVLGKSASKKYALSAAQTHFQPLVCQQREEDNV